MKTRALALLVGVILLLVLSWSLVGCGGGQTSPPSSAGDSAGGDSAANEGQSGSEGQEVYVGTVATGSAGGLYQIVASGLAKVASEHSDYLQLTATTPPSTTMVPPMVNRGEAAIGIGQTDMILRAIEGVGEFDQKHEKLRYVMGVYDNVMGQAVLKDSPIDNIRQVKGLRVGVPSETTQAIIARIYELAGVPEDSVRWAYLSYSEQATALKDGNIDVFTVTAYPKNGTLEEVAATRGIKLLKVDEDVQRRWDEQEPLLGFSTTPGGTYPGVDEDNRFYAVHTVMVANADVPDYVVYEFVKAILENPDDVRAIHPAGESTTPDLQREYLEKGFLPTEYLHPGAAKYFREIGILD